MKIEECGTPKPERNIVKTLKPGSIVEKGSPRGPLEIGRLYPINDCVHRFEMRNMGMKEYEITSLPVMSHNLFYVVPTGELRTPYTGEWFVSGAVIEGYRAAGDLHVKHRIAKLVRVRRPDPDEADYHRFRVVMNVLDVTSHPEWSFVQLRGMYAKGYRFLLDIEDNPAICVKSVDVGALMRGQYPDCKILKVWQIRPDGSLKQGNRR